MWEWFVNLSPVFQALIATIFTWLMTALGAGLVFTTKNINRKLGGSIKSYPTNILQMIQMLVLQKE